MNSGNQEPQDEWDAKFHKTTERISVESDMAVLGRIDQYEILKELGTGGFGSVYLARDTAERRLVAVKGLPREMRDSSEELERIRRNFELIVHLTHDNIVALRHLHEVNRIDISDPETAKRLNVEKGQTLLVMDYAQGLPLSRWAMQFPNGRVPLDRAIEVTRQIATALDYAHGKKIIHRDIKPQNVVVEGLEDGSVAVKVLDFGLAAEVRSSQSRSRSKSGVTDSSGTRLYMAPEQWKGKDQKAGTDQYSLAVLFHELVTGKVPFQSAFDVGDPLVAMAAVTTQEPEIPQALPKCVRKALKKALAKEPKDRFRTCGDFVAALGGKRPAASAPLWFGLGAVALAAVLAAGGFVHYRHQAEAERQAKIARQAEQKRLAEEEAKAEAAAAEAARMAEAKRIAEQKRIEEERRVAEEKKKREVERLAAEKAKEEAAARVREAEERARQAEARLAEEKRKEEARLAEERKNAAEKAKAEAEARERAAEAERERIAARQRKSGGLYKVVDLTDNTTIYLDAVPSGGWTDEYKTSKIVLRRIEPGTFTMGSPSGEEGRFDSEKPHEVTLTKPYYIGVFEVTQGQWERVMGSNPSTYKSETRPVEGVAYDDVRGKVNGSNWPNSGVVDAESFLGRLRSKTSEAGFDLPTEAQWEYACRAGTMGAYAGTLDSMTWHGSNSGCETHEVGQKRPNAWGLYDMHGNVWEWCADWYEGHLKDATDPTGPSSGASRVSRGGSWLNFARYCRSANRFWNSPGIRPYNLGFRLCCSAGPLE